VSDIERTLVTLRSSTGDSAIKKLSPPVVTGDPDLQRIVEKIYDDINTINISVNQSMAANTDHKGKQGDIRIVPDPEDPEKQLLQGFGTNGWSNFGESNKTIFRGKLPAENLHSKPDYDSGWIAVTASALADLYIIEHNLNTKMLRINVFFRFTGANSGTDYDGNGTNVRTSDVHFVGDSVKAHEYSNGDGTEMGFGIIATTDNNISIWTANDYLFTIDNFMSTAHTDVIKGEMRLFLHKIPLGK
jgi:hypothetical protein